MRRIPKENLRRTWMVFDLGWMKYPLLQDDSDRITGIIENGRPTREFDEFAGRLNGAEHPEKACTEALKTSQAQSRQPQRLPSDIFALRRMCFIPN